MNISTTLLHFGIDVAPEKWVIHAVPRPYRLYYIKGGTAHFVTDKKEFPLLKDHFYLFPSSLPFTVYQNPDDRLDHMYFDFIMSPPVVASEPVMSPLDAHPLFPEYLNLMEKVVMSCKQTKESDAYNIVSGLLDAFLRLYLTVNTVNSSLDNAILKSVEYIESHFNENIVIKDLASSLFFNEDYFIRKFKQNMGMTPYAYLSKLRLNIAVVLIAQGASLAEAAAATGYQYPSSLCHALKKDNKKL